MAGGHANRTYRPNTWLHRPKPAYVKISLANPEPSTHGTNAKCRDVRYTAAIGRYCCDKRVNAASLLRDVLFAS
jgi:hypothetical protein